MEPLLLRAAVRRGAVLVTSNWPIVPIDFAVESFCRLALALPVAGGALMVSTIVGIDVGSVIADGLAATADIVVGSLSSAPAALGAFLAALAIVAIGGEAIIFIVKAGTVSVLVDADRIAGDTPPVRFVSGSLKRVYAFRLETLVDAGRRYAGRALVLSLWLGVAYAVVAAVYLGLVSWGWAGAGAAWMPAWSLAVLVATSAALVVVSLANLAYTLLRVVIVTDDCAIRVAVFRLGRFVIEDARQVIGIFSVIAGIELLAGAASLLAAGGLALIAYLPLVSLLLVPLQIAIWLLRGLLFEFLSLSSVAAYQTQYRRFSQSRWPLPATVGAERD